MLKVIRKKFPASNLWTGEEMSKFFRKDDKKILNRIKEDFVENNLSIIKIVEKYKFREFTVRRILKENIKNYDKIIERNKKKCIGINRQCKSNRMSEETKEKLRNNENLKKAGRKLQATFWKNKDKLRKQVGYKGYLKVLNKYGKEHFQKLGLTIKTPNIYETQIKSLLKSKKVIHHYYRNGCIPDFYGCNKYVLEATCLYPLRNANRTKLKINQLKKYKQNFSEKLYLITPFVEQWKRVLKKYNLKITIINETYVKSL